MLFAARESAVKFELSIGVVAILIGLVLMISGQRMCRTSCWMEDLFRMLLPASHESWAGGVPMFLIGIAIVGHAVYRRSRMRK